MKKKHQTSPIKIASCCILTLTISLFLTGCGANESILNSGKNANSAESNVALDGVKPMPTPMAETTVDDEIVAMKTADFIYIYVLKRKDKAKLDQDDKAIARALTEHLNRRKISADGTAIIVGSNNLIPEDSMKVLKTNFDIEDHSKPGSEQK